MSRSQAEGLRLVIDATGWRLSAGKKELARADAASLPDTLALARGLEAVKVEAGSTSRTLWVTVDDPWARSFTITPPRGLRSLDELKACAQARLAQLYGRDAGAWSVRADWRVGGPFVATAVPHALEQAVRSLCRRQGWTLAALRPSWVAALAREASRAGDHWWVMGTETLATTVRADGGRVKHVHVEQLASVDRQQLEAAGARVWMRVAAAGEGERPVVNVVENASVADAMARTPGRGNLDLLDHAQRLVTGLPFGVSRIWPAALALAVLAAAGWWSLKVERELGGAIAASGARESRLIEQSKGRRVTAAPAGLFPRERVGAINAVVDRLNTSWPLILAALERSSSRDVALLSVEPDVEQGRLRGEAMARNHQAAVDYVNRLGELAPLSQATLVHHLVQEQGPIAPVRFKFEARLATGVTSGSGAARANGSSQPATSTAHPAPTSAGTGTAPSAKEGS